MKLENRYSLEGKNGNAFGVMSYTRRCMLKEGKTKSKIDEYLKKAQSGDYINLLSISQDIIDELNKGE